MSSPHEALDRLEALCKRTGEWSEWKVVGPRLVAVARAAQTYIEGRDFDKREALIAKLAALGEPADAPQEKPE